MKIIITRKIEFDAAHRVIGHENKCKYLHGHRYVLEVSVSSTALDNLGMVVDFGVIKSILKSWIDENLDHTTILSSIDKELGNKIAGITGQKIYYLDSNPTAENIALHLRAKILPRLLADVPIQIEKLKLYETPNCSTEV
ncbi:MAG: 6-carboxytetrahydropterin synthase QueD [Rickettsiaceae bacterium]|nr:6-carboxytetrahydropterin synthase QueD [Rickettsiaceae bacterium]